MPDRKWRCHAAAGTHDDVLTFRLLRSTCKEWSLGIWSSIDGPKCQQQTVWFGCAWHQHACQWRLGCYSEHQQTLPPWKPASVRHRHGQSWYIRQCPERTSCSNAQHDWRQACLYRSLWARHQLDLRASETFGLRWDVRSSATDEPHFRRDHSKTES